MNQSQPERNELMGSPLGATEAGALLKRRRMELGLTLDDVMQQSGIPTRQYVSKLESGGVHPAKSRYLPHLRQVLRLTDADWADLTGQPRPMMGVDVLHPHSLNVVTQITENLPDIGAYRVEQDSEVIVMSTTEPMRKLEVGHEYVIQPHAEVDTTSFETFLRAKAVQGSDGSVVLVAKNMVVRPDECEVIGRILFVGTPL